MPRGIKGHTNNPNGRPPDEKIKQFREGLRTKLIERIGDVFSKLDDIKDPKEYVDSYIRITKEVLPALPTEQALTDDKEKELVTIFKSIQDVIAKHKDKNEGMRKVG